MDSFGPHVEPTRKRSPSLSHIQTTTLDDYTYLVLLASTRTQRFLVLPVAWLGFLL